MLSNSHPLSLILKVTLMVLFNGPCLKVLLLSFYEQGTTLNLKRQLLQENNKARNQNVRFQTLQYTVSAVSYSVFLFISTEAKKGKHLDDLPIFLHLCVHWRWSVWGWCTYNETHMEGRGQRCGVSPLRDGTKKDHQA